MKRVLSVLTIFLLTSSLGFAQKSNFDLSFSAAPTLTWLNAPSGGVDSDLGVGFDFGLNVDYFFADNDRYAFATGLIISNFKSGLEYTGENDSRISMDYKLKYIEVPLALRLYTSQHDRSTFWGQFGLFTGYNISARGTSSDGVYDNDKIKSQINFFNVGMNIGGGMKYDLGGQNELSFAIIYNNGFTRVVDNDYVDSNGSNSVKLKVAYIF